MNFPRRALSQLWRRCDRFLQRFDQTAGAEREAVLAAIREKNAQLDELCVADFVPIVSSGDAPIITVRREVWDEWTGLGRVDPAVRDEEE